MERKNKSISIICRIIEFCVWIFCFWMIRYIVVEYVHPLRPITPDMSDFERNMVSFGRSGIITKQNFDSFFFSWIFSFFIMAYYSALGALKYKRRCKGKPMHECISDKRKIIYFRVAVVFFIMVFLLCGSIPLLHGQDKLFGVSLMSVLILAMSLGPLYIFSGLSKGYDFAFALKMTGCVVALLVICIVLKIPPYFAPLAGALPFSVRYGKKLDEAWKPFKRNNNQ